MGYYRADIYDANFTKRGTVYGKTKKELISAFTEWKRERDIPVNSSRYIVTDLRYVG